MKARRSPNHENVVERRRRQVAHKLRLKRSTDTPSTLSWVCTIHPAVCPRRWTCGPFRRTRRFWR